MAGTISKGTNKGAHRRKSGGPFSFVSPVSKSGLYYYRNPTSYLQLAAEEVGTPLTVKVLDGELTDELQQGEILTMHKILEVVKLKCVKPSGESFELPVELEASVENIRVDTEECYKTIGDVLVNQKEDHIQWIVVSKPFVYQGFVYNAGTIFEVLPDSDENNEYLTVEVHPGRLMVFLPINIRGEFYKIESPYELKKQKLIDLKQQEAPMLIIPKLKTFPTDFIQSTELTNDRLLVAEKITEKFVIASTFKNDDFYIHIFPLTVEVSCEILLGGIPVDILRQKEIAKVEKKLFSLINHKIDYTMSMPYKTAGIERSRSSKNKIAKLKKKDITLPESLLDNEYSRYIAKPTSLMRELGQTINGPVEAPTIVRMNTIAKKPTKKKVNNNDEERDRNRESIACLLKKAELEHYEELFCNEQIDCKLLTRFDENDFLELGLKMDDVQKLYSSIHSLELEPNKPDNVEETESDVVIDIGLTHPDKSALTSSDSGFGQSDISDFAESDISDLAELDS